MRRRYCDHAVSHIVGYALTLFVTALVATTSILMTNNIIEEKYVHSAEIYATNIANKVSDAIVNVCLMNENYPFSDYSTEVEIPRRLVDKYYYYVEINNRYVYVNSTDGKISVSNTNYNVSERLFYDIAGVSDVGSDNVKIFFDATDYVYRFDFGTNDSSDSKSGFMRVSHNTKRENWYDTDYRYRAVIFVDNPIPVSQGGDLSYYQVLIQLNNKNFDFTTVNGNGSDLRFYHESGSLLDYWIERWYPDGSYTSRIWVNVTDLDAGGVIIYMYHGFENAMPMSDGDSTFIFFDDFDGDLDLSKWDVYQPGAIESRVETENGFLIITNESAVVNKIDIDPDPATGVPVIIEAKAKGIDDYAGREADMFVRDDGIASAPYEDAYVFSSSYVNLGENSGNYLTAIRYIAADSWDNITTTDKPVLNDKWNRLRYIMNHTDNVICRYYYENFEIDGYAAFIGTKTNGNFGLCVINYNVTAYYDWVYVRRFAQRTNIHSGSQADREPFAYINQTQSLDFWWDNPEDVYVKSFSNTNREIVCGFDDAVLRIMNLTEGEYSVVFSLGDGGPSVSNVENMCIEFDGDPDNDWGSEYKTDVSDIGCYPYKTVWKSNIMVDSDHELKITFKDADYDGAPIEPDEEWAVAWMTLQKGDRIIRMGSG